MADMRTECSSALSPAAATAAALQPGAERSGQTTTMFGCWLPRWFACARSPHTLRIDHQKILSTVPDEKSSRGRSNEEDESVIAIECRPRQAWPAQQPVEYASPQCREVVGRRRGDLHGLFALNR